MNKVLFSAIIFFVTMLCGYVLLIFLRERLDLGWLGMTIPSFLYFVLGVISLRNLMDIVEKDGN